MKRLAVVPEQSVVGSDPEKAIVVLQQGGSRKVLKALVLGVALKGITLAPGER